MQVQSNLIHIKRKPLFFVLLSLFILAIATPVLADYLGPDRTTIETEIETYDYGVWADKNDKSCNPSLGEACIQCTWERDPYKASCAIKPATSTYYWYKLGTRSEVVETVVHLPPATISSSLQNCTLNNGWCVTAPELRLNGSEPLSGYTILAIEGTRNGQTFACSGSTCNVPLSEGNNTFTFWALSSYGDSSTLGSLTAKVDSQQPNITGTFSGTTGLNGWYLSPITFNGSAFDPTSGLADFTCNLDGVSLPSCNSITVNNAGIHTLVLTARDNAGNTRTLNHNASIDTQNPAMTASLNGTLGSNNWYTTAALDVSASDPAPGSGLVALEYNLDNSGWITFPASGTLTLPDGKHQIEIHAIDNAGRMVSSSKSFWLDSLEPNVALDSSGTLGANNWYTTALTLTASASDPSTGSGQASGMDLFEYSLNNGAWTTYTSPLTLSDGAHTVSFWAQDLAGLVTQVHRAYQVDTRAPRISGSLNGTPGANGWYVSEVILSASAFDPAPGSGLDTFTYTLNGAPETSYTDALTLTDGTYNIQLRAQDKAGLTESLTQTVRVDSTAPTLNIASILPAWSQGAITIKGTSSDSGSGLAKVEISTDGATWQPVNGAASWSYEWDTTAAKSGLHQLRVRAVDNAGLTTEQVLPAGVDNSAPQIVLPDSWFQWDTVTLDVWDNDSGLSEVRVEISDPEGRWQTRKIDLDVNSFPLDFKWDRRFGDGAVAPIGTYTLKVIAVDNLDNATRQSAAVKILLDMLPAGPTATPQPYVRADSTPAPAATAVSMDSVAVAQTPVVSAFGSTPEPESQAAATPEKNQTMREAPIQTSVLEWLQSIFVPNANAVERASIVETTDESGQAFPSASSNTNVLWGATAAAMLGATMAYALEEKRKRKEEEAKEREEAYAKAAQLNAAEAQRKVNAWLEGQAILNAHIQEAEKQGATQEEIAKLKQKSVEKGLGVAIASATELNKSLYHTLLLEQQNARMEAKRERIEQEEERQWAEAQQHKAEQEVQAERAHTADTARWAAMAAHYAASNSSPNVPPKEEEKMNWWEKTKSFVQDNITQPIHMHVYQPFIKPATEMAKEVVSTSVSWIEKNVHQPYIKPAIENTKENFSKGISWVNERVYQPYIQPDLEKAKQAVSNGVAWVNQNVYQPYIKPEIDRQIQQVTAGIAWVNERVYQPFIKPAIDLEVQRLASGVLWVNEHFYQPVVQPALAAINETVYQPFVEPLLEHAKDAAISAASWVNENIYQPIFEPVVNDINKHIFQPLADAAHKTWDKYGEWVHGALDAAGLIPGFGEIADGLNGLIYLGEGRYLEAGISAMAMIPILGDLGKAGKWTIKLGSEVVEVVAETTVKTALKEIAENAAQKAAEKVVKETLEEGLEKTTKEALENAAEKAAGNALEKSAKEMAQVALAKTVQEAGERIPDTVIKDTAERSIKEFVAGITAKEVARDAAEKTVVEEVAKQSLKLVDEESVKLITALTEIHGKEAVERFLPLCEKYGINPADALTKPPAEGQSLIGWVLGIENPANPVNHSLVNLNQTQADLDNILNQSIFRPESKTVVLGYGGGCAKPYYALSDETGGCHLSLSAESWAPFAEAKANFWTDINGPFVEKSIEQRKIFLFNIEYDVITNPRNAERFSLPELHFIELEQNNYVNVPLGEYTALVPVELLDTYQQYLPSGLFVHQ